MSVEGVDATEAAVVASMLASDNVPDENQAAACFSCKAPLTGLFCSECGQKNDNYRRSIFSLIADLFGSIFSLESRIWRTWGNLLFRPGKVAREFSDGRRMFWSSPVRVYLAMSIILFGFMGVTGTHLLSIDLDVTRKDNIEKPVAELTKDDLEMKWATQFFETQRQIDARNKDRDFELIEKWLGSEPNRQAERALEAATNAVEGAQIPAEAQEDLQEMSQELGIGGETDSNGNFNLTINGKKLDSNRATELVTGFIKNPAVLTASFNKWLPRLMFIMMPFTMLLGAVFIRDREKGLLFDHLVHAAYIHAVAFFLLFAGILLSKVLPGSLVFQAIFIGLLIYLPLSLKRMFGRGWFKTLLTSYSVGFIYLIIISAALIGVISWDISKTVTL